MSTAASTLHRFVTDPVEFTIAIPQEEQDDLKRRLSKSRWTPNDVVPTNSETMETLESTSFGYGSFGPPLEWVKGLAQEWHAEDYDYLERQRYWNTFNHFTVDIDDSSVHFLHHRSSNAHAIPLILIHGWPGSFLEFLHVIPLLTNPTQPDAQAFHVVVPSQPGFAFSSAPKNRHWGMIQTALLFDKLMTGLGYDRYAAQGGDWGSITARLLGSLPATTPHCAAVHLNFCPAPPSPSFLSWIPSRTLLDWIPKSWTFALSKIERIRAEKALQYLEKGSAYYSIQQWTPRTASYGLNDSPIGLLGWIGEKMAPSVEMAAGDSDAPTLTRRDILDTCSLYWFTNSIGTSFLPYTLNPHFQSFLSSPSYFLPNFAISIFPNEIAIVPEAWARATGNCGWYKEAGAGGHFAALEAPAEFATHLTEAFAAIWPGEELVDVAGEQ